MIPFNRPYLAGNEIKYIKQAIKSGHISGNGQFTQKCQSFFENKYGFKKCLMTTSCTDALEMAGVLLDIQEGDEIIIPSYTFVSVPNAFVLKGATIRFVDSESDHPNMDISKIEALINSKTKAIIAFHYAGIALDMNKLVGIANKHHIYVIEDVAHSIDSYYQNKALGSFGHFACFSFHETKNIQAGEGGMLAINDEKFIDRAETIWEKGTNRAAFTRGEVEKYEWIDKGASYLPNELTAAYLFAQLEKLEFIQNKRLEIWNYYFEKLNKLCDSANVGFPIIPSYGTNNAHIFYMVLNSEKKRDGLISHLQSNNILGIFHYLALHNSPYYRKNNSCNELRNAESFEKTLIRLPFYIGLKNKDLNNVVKSVINYF